MRICSTNILGGIFPLFFFCADLVYWWNIMSGVSCQYRQSYLHLRPSRPTTLCNRRSNIAALPLRRRLAVRQKRRCCRRNWWQWRRWLSSADPTKTSRTSRRQCQGIYWTTQKTFICKNKQIQFWIGDYWRTYLIVSTNFVATSQLPSLIRYSQSIG